MCMSDPLSQVTYLATHMLCMQTHFTVLLHFPCLAIYGSHCLSQLPMYMFMFVHFATLEPTNQCGDGLKVVITWLAVSLFDEII